MFGVKARSHQPHSVEAPGGLSGAARDYFEAFGVHPPTIPIGVTIDGLSRQIEDMRRVAATTDDQAASTRLVHEMAYLAHAQQQLINTHEGQL